MRNQLKSQQFKPLETPNNLYIKIEHIPVELFVKYI